MCIFKCSVYLKGSVFLLLNSEVKFKILLLILENYHLDDIKGQLSIQIVYEQVLFGILSMVSKLYYKLTLRLLALTY